MYVLGKSFGIFNAVVTRYLLQHPAVDLFLVHAPLGAISHFKDKELPLFSTTLPTEAVGCSERGLPFG